MNREQRRQAERVQARSRATRRVQRPLPIPMIVKAATALGPLEEILDQLERHGTIHVDERGRPIFLAPLENEWFAMVPALQGEDVTQDMRNGFERLTEVLCTVIVK